MSRHSEPVDQLRRGYLARAQAPLDEDKARSFHIANSNFISLIDDKDAHSELWRVIHGFKLDEVMHDILMREDFLDEPQTEIDDLIQNIAAIVKYLQENPAGTASEVVAAKQRIRKRIPAATQHLWDNRERLGLWLPGHISMEMNPVCHLLLRYAEIGEVDTPILSQFMLYLWVYSPYPPAQMGEFLYLHSARYNSALSNDTRARDAYLRAAIVEGIGPDAFIVRLRRELQRPGVAESPEIIGACVAALNDSLLLPELLPYIRKHSILDVLAMILDTYCKIGGVEGRARPILYNHTTYFLRHCANLFINTILSGDSSPDIIPRGEHVVAFLACGVDLVSEDCEDFGDDDRRNLRKDLHDYCKVALKMSRSRKPLAREFYAGLHARAREDWWPCLARLQVAKYRSNGSTPYALLLEHWTELGAVLGLDEEKERKRHRKEERVFCSWPQCEFNTKRPPSKLSTCQGCGEAQYCGRTCQKSDWNSGGHKKRCGTRIKG